jgi:hypothetical protein
MSDDRPEDEPVPPLAQRASKVPVDDESDAAENAEHSALVAEIVARDKSLLDRLAES